MTEQGEDPADSALGRIGQCRMRVHSWDRRYWTRRVTTFYQYSAGSFNDCLVSYSPHESPSVVVNHSQFSSPPDQIHPTPDAGIEPGFSVLHEIPLLLSRFKSQTRN